MAVDLTTKARVQALLASGGQKTTPFDSWLPTLISDVSARFERYMGRGTKAEARTEDFDAAPDVDRFFLEAYPVSAVASVSYDPDRAFGAETVLDADSYALDARRGIVILDHYALGRYSPRAVRIVYTGGLGAAAANVVSSYPDLALAADLQIAHLLKQRNALGATAVSAGGGSTSFVGGYALLPEVVATLESYRRRLP